MTRVCSKLLLSCSLLSTSACGREDPTLAIEIVTTPNSDLLERAASLRVEIATPPSVQTFEKQAGGFDVALSVAALTQRTSVNITALDAQGEIIAVGRTPRLVFAPIGAGVRVFLAPQNSVVSARAEFSQALAQRGAAAVPLGALFAGGSNSLGTPQGNLEIYNGFTHEIQTGGDLPSPRIAPAVANNGSPAVVIVGGGGDESTPLGWVLDTSVAPRGRYIPLSGEGDRSSGLVAVPIAATEVEQYIVSGRPAVIDGQRLTVTAQIERELPVQGALVREQNAAWFFAGSGDEAAVTKVSSDRVHTRFPLGANFVRTGHSIVATSSGLIVIAGADRNGLTTSVVRIDPSTGAATEVSNVLAVARRDAAVATAARGTLLVVAGGRDSAGVPLASVEVFDAASLERVTTLALAAPRHSAFAVELPSGQTLIAGGSTSGEQAIQRIELFTPATP